MRKGRPKIDPERVRLEKRRETVNAGLLALHELLRIAYQKKRKVERQLDLLKLVKEPP